MAIIKCKMCGGDMVLNEEKTFGTCEYCGSTMTLPKVSDDQRAARFNRGNHFRRQGDFDKALAVYESIVREDDTDAEAHWCCALCRFGIEYVEDPNTFEYLPTCHRASFDSFLEDVDYLAALEHSDGITRRQYQKDAAKIAEVQRGILATSQNEEPFDVFICYKETDDDTKERTRDSLDAQEIYYQLTQEGYRVFFSRITLEDKVGTEYEPYIFAALNSAKVMVAIGSKPEYFGAVWVKNEWSRFLAMMRKDRSKLLLPCYKGMDPYELPEQLSVLQSYDMSKIGFMQDLIRGIKKVLQKDEPKAAAQPAPQPVVQQVVQSGGPSTANLMRRGQIFLEEKNWTSAEEYFNKVLDIEAENGNAYLGLALTKAQCANLDAFVQKLGAQYTNEAEQTLPACESAAERIEALSKKLAVPGYLSEDRIVGLFDYSLTYNSREAAAKANKDKTLAALRADRNYTRAVQYADPALKTRLAEAEKQIASACDRRIEQAKSDAAAAKADVVKRYEAFLSEQEQDAEELSRNAADRRERDYREACETQKTAGDEVIKYRTAAAAFGKLAGYRDAEERAAACKAEADRLEAEQKKAAQEAAARAERRAREKKKKITIIVLAAAALVAALTLLMTLVIIPADKYKKAEALMAEGKYREAIAAFEALGNYKDSADRIPEAKYKAAEALLEEGDKCEAVIMFVKAANYRDARSRSLALWEEIAQRDTVSAGWHHTVGLKADGTVVAVGDNDDGQCGVSGWTDIVAVSAGDLHTVGLKADGTVVAVGNNDYGQCGVSGWTDIVAVSAGDCHTVGLKADGTVVAVGGNLSGQCGVSGWTDIVAVSAGGIHTVGLKSDGTVVAVGDNDNGQCGVSGWTDIVAVSAGGYYTVGLKSDGTVVAVGWNINGQCNVSGWTDIVAVSAGSSHTVGLKSDGTVVAVGWNYYGQCDVSGWTDIVAVSAGGSHTVGLKADGTVVAVGDNDDGQCDVSGWNRNNIKRPNAR